MVSDLSEEVPTTISGLRKEAGGNSFLQNIGNHLPEHAVP